MKDKNIELGKIGENIACKYLKKNKYKIIKRNFECKIGEIDIIALKDKCVVFVEVKTRTNDFFGRPSEAVNTKKQNKIRMVSQCFLKLKKKMDCQIRYDVIEIIDNEVNHIIDAF